MSWSDDRIRAAGASARATPVVGGAPHGTSAADLTSAFAEAAGGTALAGCNGGIESSMVVIGESSQQGRVADLIIVKPAIKNQANWILKIDPQTYHDRARRTDAGTMSYFVR